MVRIKTENFTVKTTGQGNPDYAQPSSTTLITQQLVTSYPQMEDPGKRYEDYASISFTTTQQEYVIGANANAARSGSWGTNVIAKDILFYASEDCYVRFNESNAVPMFVPKELPLRLSKRTEKIYVYGASGSGTLNVWIEG